MKLQLGAAFRRALGDTHAALEDLSLRDDLDEVDPALGASVTCLVTWDRELRDVAARSGLAVAPAD